MKKMKEEIEMLHVIKDDFDESPEDILNSINKMLQKKEETENEEKKEESNDNGEKEQIKKDFIDRKDTMSIRKKK